MSLNPNPLCSHSSHYYFLTQWKFFFVWWSPCQGPLSSSSHVSLDDLEIRKPRELLCRGHDSCKRLKKTSSRFCSSWALASNFHPQILLQSKKKNNLEMFSLWDCQSRDHEYLLLLCKLTLLWNSTYEYACTPGNYQRQTVWISPKRPTPAMLWLTAKRKSCTFSKLTKSGLIRRTKRIFLYLLRWQRTGAAEVFTFTTIWLSWNNSGRETQRQNHASGRIMIRTNYHVTEHEKRYRDCVLATKFARHLLFSVRSHRTYEPNNLNVYIDAPFVMVLFLVNIWIYFRSSPKI